MLSDAAMRERMLKGWRGGLKDGTICGDSSTIAKTQAVRNWLPVLCDAYGIRSVCDAGAGDLHWIKHVSWTVEYRAFDLIPRSDHVSRLDVTSEQLPVCDLILCRAVLNHLDAPRIKMALDLFRQSGKYLLATQFSGVTKAATEFCRLDLRTLLGDPIDSIADTCGKHSELALWTL